MNFELKASIEGKLIFKFSNLQLTFIERSEIIIHSYINTSYMKKKSGSVSEPLFFFEGKNPYALYSSHDLIFKSSMFNSQKALIKALAKREFVISGIL